MKLSITIASDNAPSSAFVVWRGFEDSIRKASEYGYDGVELALKSANEVDRDLLRQWLNRYQLEVSAISTGQVFACQGLYFTHPNPEIRQKTLTVFGGLIDLAGDFGKAVNVGRARGFVAPGQSREEADALFLEMMDRLCTMAESRGVRLMVEPVNRYESNFINNLDEGGELLRRLNRGNAGLMPDVFHMNIEEAHLGASLVRNAEWVQYVHLADSNRLAPGDGHLDFQEIFQALRTIGFTGWASVEILPKPDADTAARRAANFLLPRIHNGYSSIKERE